MRMGLHQLKQRPPQPFPPFSFLIPFPSSHFRERDMDGFPAGLRVLVVDDDPTWLKILEKMLKKCSYEVTTCCRARAALEMLRERKDRFDIVISDVNMPDMDGFKLLEQVGLEMDLPVIMMSVDGETSKVMKGVQHGACDYLLKPIRMKELKIIWQHVYRKKINEMKEIENYDHDSNEGTPMKTGLDDSEDEFFLSGSDLNCTKKRKEMGSEENGSQGFNNDSGSAKKVRVVWSVDLHQRFVNAVNQIGFDKVGPKKILDLMNVPGLTRENVASHLQKYRLYLSRLQKKNEPDTSFCGIEQSDFSFNDHPGKSGHQSLTMTKHNSFNRFGYPDDKSIIQDIIPEIPENEVKSIVSFLPATEAKSTLRGDATGAQKSNAAPQLGIVHQFGGTSFGCTISQKQSWSGESSVMQSMKHVKQGHDPYLGYPHLSSHSQRHHFQLDHEKTSASPNAKTYTSYTDKTGPSEIRPLCAEHKSNQVRNVSPLAGLTDSFSEKLPQGFGAMPASSASSTNLKLDLSRQTINCWESPQSSTLKNGLFSASSHEDLQLYTLESYARCENFWLDSMDLFNSGDSSSITELQSYLYDGLRFNCDFQTDLMEHPIIDEGVFIS